MEGLGYPDKSRLLQWYDEFSRPLPWRENPEPWSVLLSEFILQQTKMEVGVGYWERMIARFPTLLDMASSSLDEVMEIWQGCGYYARARNLHALSIIIASRNPPILPSDPNELQKLPGIGPYTAAAIASISFEIPISVVDGNVRRVYSRLNALENPKPSVVKTWAQSCLDYNRPGDWNQAVMELGATICTPRKPRCEDCPISSSCSALLTSDPTMFPLSKRRVSKKILGHALVINSPEGVVLSRRKGSQLGGLWGVPISEDPNGLESLCSKHDVESPIKVGEIRHAFSHRDFNLQVWRIDVMKGGIPSGSVPISRLDQKILDAAGCGEL
ncbi:MAG: A/G-specific adenine glycosylase [Candidatus Thalassarchaeaceae archaeon]|nr:A/G-specific adenine glycosylase [Candidatus Thalassarchaeaceae archaeon]